MLQSDRRAGLLLLAGLFALLLAMPGDAVAHLLVTEPDSNELSWIDEATGQVLTVGSDLALPVDVSVTASGLYAVVEAHGFDDGAITLFGPDGFIASFPSPPQATVLHLTSAGTLLCGTNDRGLWRWATDSETWVHASGVPGNISGILEAVGQYLVVTRGDDGALFIVQPDNVDDDNWEILGDVGDARGIVALGGVGALVAVARQGGGALVRLTGLLLDAITLQDLAELSDEPGALAVHGDRLYVSLRSSPGRILTAPLDAVDDLEIYAESDELVRPAGLAWTDMCPFVDVDEDEFSWCDGDCDDFDENTYPNAPELCDEVDNDCDGVVPTDEIDGDGDGIFVCEGDCDDDDATVHPGAEELCDGLDNDCDGLPGPDEGDADGDGAAGCGEDCDDGDPSIHPGAVEYCDPGEVDEDCDGTPRIAGWTEADGDVGTPECVPYVLPGFTFECSSAGRPAGLALILLVAVALIFRRRRAAHLGAGAALLLAVLLPSGAGAQDLEQAQRQLDFCWAEAAAGNFERAKISADSALRLHGSLHEAMVCKALAYEGLGDFEMADAMLKTYFDFRGGLEPAQQALALRQRLDDPKARRKKPKSKPAPRDKPEPKQQPERAPAAAGPWPGAPADEAPWPTVAVGLSGGWQLGGSWSWVVVPIDLSIKLWKPLRAFVAFVPAISQAATDPGGIAGDPPLHAFLPALEFGLALRHPGKVRILGALYGQLAFLPEDYDGVGDEGDLFAPFGPGGMIAAEFPLPGTPLALRAALDGGAMFAERDQSGLFVLPSLRVTGGLVLSL